MSGFWKKGYYILCFIVRTLYNLLSLEKKLENFSPKNLEVKKKSLPLQPQSRNDSERVL